MTAAASGMFAAGAAATEYEYGLTAGIGRSDNVTRVPANEQEETIAMAGLELRANRHGGRVDANADVDLYFHDYQDDTFDDEFSGLANAEVQFKLVPDRFTWVATDNFGQATTEPFEPSTPDNRENINYFTTGPDLTFHLGSFGDLTTFARYTSTNFEVSEFDDQRLLGGVSVGRDVSSRGNLSLNATTERIEFDEPDSGSNYDRHSLFFRYEFDGARTRLRADGGVSEIHDLGSTISNPLLEVDLARSVSARSTLTLRGGIRSADAASALRYGLIPGGGTPGRPEQVSSTDPFETRHAAIIWQFSGLRTELMLLASLEKEVHERETDLDRKRNFFRAVAEREIGSRFSVRAQASFYRFDFENGGQQDDETELALYLSWNAAGRFHVEADVEQVSRDSTDPLTDFDETRVFLRLVWRDQLGSPVAR